MQKESQKTLLKIVKTPLWIFTIGVFSTINAINTIIKTINMMINNIPIMELPIFSLDFFESIMQIVCVFILYFFYKSYLKHKSEVVSIVSDVNNGFSVTTDNINDSHRINDLKIRYVDFRVENKELNDEQFIIKLHENGFSKEDLEEINIDKHFLEKNKDKLLPRAVINKYISFKKELDKHKNNII